MNCLITCRASSSVAKSWRYRVVAKLVVDGAGMDRSQRTGMVTAWSDKLKQRDWVGLRGLGDHAAEPLSKPPPSATRPPLLEVRKLAIRGWLCNPQDRKSTRLNSSH